MDTLSRISQQNSRDKGILTGRSELSTLLSDVSLALLRKRDSWSAAHISGERFNGMDGAQRAQPYFQRQVVQERSKFDQEVSPSDDNNRSSDRNSDFVMRRTFVPERGDFASARRTQAVVSMVVAMRGRSDALSQGAVTAAEVARCLQTLASEALTDDGENVMGVEVLWMPSERGRTLSNREMLLDYPELLGL